MKLRAASIDACQDPPARKEMEAEDRRSKAARQRHEEGREAKPKPLPPG